MKLLLFCLAVIGVSLSAWSQAPASPGASRPPGEAQSFAFRRIRRGMDSDV